MTANDQILNATTSHQISVGRFGSAQANSVDSYLNAANREIRKEILSGWDGIRTKKDIRSFLRLISDLLKGYYTKWTDSLNKSLADFAGYEAGFNARILESATDADINTVSGDKVISAAENNPMQLDNQAVFMGTAIAGWVVNEVARANKSLTLSFTQKRSASEAAQGVSDIIKGRTRNNARAIATTSTDHVSVQSKDVTNKANSIVIGYMLVATLDFRTSSMCRDYHSDIVLKTDKFKPMPPFHYNCRTTTSSVVVGGTPESKGYYDWLKGQPAELQDQALGKTKGLIFRNSGLTAEEFKNASVNRLNQPLTIAEMAKNDDRIMSYIDK